MDETIELLLCMTKYEQAIAFMSKEQESEFRKRNGLFNLTLEDKKKFDKITLEDLYEKIKNKFEISAVHPISIYEEGIIHFVDQDRREYRTTLKNLGFILEDGVYVKT